MLYVIWALVILFAAVVAIRTLRFKPISQRTTEYSPADCDTAIVNNFLDEATESYDDFMFAFPRFFPSVYKDCIIYRLPNKCLVVEHRGKNSAKNPSVLCASYENKAVFGGILAGAENLFRNGFIPEGRLYIILYENESLDEGFFKDLESWFSDKNVIPELVLCEGGISARDVFPGVKGSCAFIGTADLLSREDKGYYPVPLLDMINTLGRRTCLKYRIIYANLWCFGSLLKCTEKHGSEEYIRFLSMKNHRTGPVSPASGIQWRTICSSIKENLSPDEIAACPQKNIKIASAFTGICRHVYRFSPDETPQRCESFYVNLIGRL